MSSKLSQRSRTLSQRRRNRERGDGVDLSGQDQAMDRESGLWIPASEHQGNGYEDHEIEDDDAPSTIASEQRGREEERHVEA